MIQLRLPLQYTNGSSDYSYKKEVYMFVYIYMYEHLFYNFYIYWSIPMYAI